MVGNEETNQVTHYAEKPESFVSDIISTGLFVCSPSFLDDLAASITQQVFDPRDVPRTPYVRDVRINFGDD